MDRMAQSHKGLCEGDCERENYFRISDKAAEGKALSPLSYRRHDEWCLLR